MAAGEGHRVGSQALGQGARAAAGGRADNSAWVENTIPTSLPRALRADGRHRPLDSEVAQACSGQWTRMPRALRHLALRG